MPKFYLTTPIYYVNARPHIGHAYSTIVADVIARRHRLLCDDTFFLTGTDEHGQKVERSAAAAGIPPQQFADQVSATFRDLWHRMGITHNDYIRTTDPRHKRGVQKLWRDLEARDAIYLSTYTGQYCVSEEMFVDGPPGTIGPDGKPTEAVTEENYFFRLSDYQQRLIDLIESGTLHIQPESSRNEVLSFVRGGLKDLSISRTSFTWGIPVPGNEKHVIYVWLDALANYMTALGYGSDAPEDLARFNKYWPADLHLVGKEITRFHCIYWPAFLMAAGLPLPKSIVANGWLLFQDSNNEASKMSKSKGNVVRTETILDAFGPLCPPQPTHSPPPTLSSFAEGGGPAFLPPTKTQQDLFATDILRYFLLREIPFGQDGNFSFDALVTRYNADLANGYGNLVSRTLAMIAKYNGGMVNKPDTVGSLSSLLEANLEDSLKYLLGAANPLGELGDREEDRDLFRRQVDASLAPLITRRFHNLIGFYDFASAIKSISDWISQVDGLITSKAPWKLATDESAQVALQEILYTAAESIRIITALLYPILPYATAQVWTQLGLGNIEQAAKNGELKNLHWGGLKPGTKLGPLTPIFPRADKGLAQIMTDMEAANASKPSPTESAKSVSSVLSLSPADAASTDPAAGPRTAAFTEPNPGATVAGSNALTTERVHTPHTEAAPSGIFAEPQASTHITIDDFLKVDLRVAQILVAERIPKADKLLRLEVDLGTERRQILSGIAEWYTPEELLGRRIIIVANLAPRKMRGLDSHGMLLAASAGDNTKPILTTFPDTETLPLGSRVR